MLPERTLNSHASIAIGQKELDNFQKLLLKDTEVSGHGRIKKWKFNISVPHGTIRQAMLSVPKLSTAHGQNTTKPNS